MRDELTLREAVAMTAVLGRPVARRTLCKWIARGYLPSRVVQFGKWRVHTVSIEDLRRAVQTVPQRGRRKQGVKSGDP